MNWLHEHLGTVVIVVTACSVFFSALSARMSDDYKAAHPTINLVVGALADLFVNLPAAAKKLGGAVRK